MATPRRTIWQEYCIVLAFLGFLVVVGQLKQHYDDTPKRLDADWGSIALGAMMMFLAICFWPWRSENK